MIAAPPAPKGEQLETLEVARRSEYIERQYIKTCKIRIKVISKNFNQS